MSRCWGIISMYPIATIINNFIIGNIGRHTVVDINPIPIVINNHIICDIGTCMVDINSSVIIFNSTAINNWTIITRIIKRNWIRPAYTAVLNIQVTIVVKIISIIQLRIISSYITFINVKDTTIFYFNFINDIWSIAHL